MPNLKGLDSNSASNSKHEKGANRPLNYLCSISHEVGMIENNFMGLILAI